jgi:6-phosphofructokinase 1
VIKTEKAMASKIGILTAGNDVPGLNAAIRSVGKTAKDSNIDLIGFQDGFNGLVENRFVQFVGSELSGILTLGGTLLGTSQDLPIGESDTDRFIELAKINYKKHKLDGLVILGGAMMQVGALLLSEAGLNIISLPKSISNDLYGTDYTIGFDTALSVAAEAIDRLHSTAHSHHRIIIVEILGRYSGWLTLGAGIAGGADVILIPEIPYNMKNVANAIQERNRAGKKFSLVAVSEGAITQENVEFFQRNRQINERIREGKEREFIQSRLQMIENQYSDNTNLLSHLLKDYTGLDTPVTILGYLLRGGIPSAVDRLRATELGMLSVASIRQGKSGFLLGYKGNEIVEIPLRDVAGLHHSVPLEHNWIASAKKVGTCFGD